MADNLIFTKRDLIDLIAGGSGINNIQAAIEDSFENRVDITTPFILKSMGGAVSRIEFKDDGCVEISAPLDQSDLPNRIAAKESPDLKIKLSPNEDGDFALTSFSQAEPWDGDTGYIKGWVVVTEAGIDGVDASMNIKSLDEIHCHDLANKLKKQNAQSKRDRYARELAIATRIEAAQSPEDIADIIELHTKRLKVKQDAKDLIAELKAEGRNHELVEMFEQAEASSVALGFGSDLVVSKVLTKVNDAEGFGMAAAIYRNHFVHKSDRDAKFTPSIIPDRSEHIMREQRKRCELFVQNFAENPREKVEKALRACGAAISSTLALGIHGAQKQLGSIAEIMIYSSEDTTSSFRALESGQLMLKVFTDAAKEGDAISLLLKEGPSGSPAADLQAVLDRIDPIGSSGTIMLNGYKGSAEKARQERFAQFDDLSAD